MGLLGKTPLNRGMTYTGCDPGPSPVPPWDWDEMAETLAAVWGPPGNNHVIRVSKQKKWQVLGSSWGPWHGHMWTTTSQIVIIGETESADFLKVTIFGCL